MQKHTIPLSLQPLWLLLHANVNVATYPCFPNQRTLVIKKLPAKKKLPNLNSANFPLLDYFEPNKWSVLILAVLFFSTPSLGKDILRRTCMQIKVQGTEEACLSQWNKQKGVNVKKNTGLNYHGGQQELSTSDPPLSPPAPQAFKIDNRPAISV